MLVRLSLICVTSDNLYKKKEQQLVCFIEKCTCLYIVITKTIVLFTELLQTQLFIYSCYKRTCSYIVITNALVRVYSLQNHSFTSGQHQALSFIYIVIANALFMSCCYRRSCSHILNTQALKLLYTFVANALIHI